MNEIIQLGGDATTDGSTSDTASVRPARSMLAGCFSGVVNAAVAAGVVVAYLAGAYGDDAASAGTGD